MSDHRFDVLIVGAGPAGIAAACAASGSGRRTGVVDDNPAAGGQIWRGRSTGPIARFHRSGAQFFTATTVFDGPAAGVLHAESADGLIELRYDRLIIATGARERFLPFPGWTLPNVMGAGALQALVKYNLPIEGKRVVVAGSGPLLLAVAAHLRQRGAQILVIAEQAPWKRLARFTLALGPAKIAQAARLTYHLLGTPYVTGCWPVSAEGDEKVEAVVLQRGSRTRRENCDYLACSFGLVPNLELPVFLGCAVREGFVAVNEWQETSVPGVFCAGEPTGVGGADLASIEGEIAGYAATGRLDRARRKFGTRRRAVRFQRALDRAFALQPELQSLPAPETVICRCEDVPLSRVRDCRSWKSAKLQTRCGMGPCQGRVCGPAVEFLLGWRPDSARPPIFPARVESMTAFR
jgi:NADPH-dependent 2,4-dienoyl-CoA reductase/sulfur reductase-like enzyme